MSDLTPGDIADGIEEYLSRGQAVPVSRSSWETIIAALRAPSTERQTFKQWWYERGGKLPHDATKREVAILAWSAAMEARVAPSAGVQSANTSIMGYVLAVEDLSGSERAGYMRVYGPQYHTREQAERDAKLPMARGQRAEVWEVHAPTDSRTGEARGLDDARDAARWRKFNEVAKRHLDSYTGILRFYLPRDGLGYKTFEETIDSYIPKDA